MPNCSYDGRSEATASRANDDGHTEEDIYLGLVDTIDTRNSVRPKIGGALHLGYCSSCGDQVQSQRLVPCMHGHLCEECSEDVADCHSDGSGRYYDDDDDDDDGDSENSEYGEDESDEGYPSGTKRGNHGSRSLKTTGRRCECPICAQLKMQLVLRIVVHMNL